MRWIVIHHRLTNQDKSMDHQVFGQGLGTPALHWVPVYPVYRLSCQRSIASNCLSSGKSGLSVPSCPGIKMRSGGARRRSLTLWPQHWEYFIICKYYLQITVCHWCSKPSENFKRLPWSYWSLGSWQRQLRISSERKEVKAGSQVSRALANEE